MKIVWLLLFLLCGCLTGRVSDVDAEEGFDWDALKRDQIVMTPLVDLRQAPSAPPGQTGLLQFFSDAECRAYPETFKQSFFKLRKDIRVFGAGGAYEGLAKLPNLKDLAAKAMAKVPFAAADVDTVRALNQDIRFVFFFAVVEERLSYGFNYLFRPDRPDDLLEYSSTRALTVRLALWDSKANKTVWRGTERLEPTETSAIEVRNPTKRLKRERDGRTRWIGIPLATNLTIEREKNPDRFPTFPAREPAFTASFDRFALSLPIEPSEEKLIEYTHFSYHRPELALRTGTLGKDVVPLLQLGFSSAINYNLRFGGAALIPLGSAKAKSSDKTYDLTMAAFGATFDYEWALAPNTRLLTGFLAGGATLTAAPETKDQDQNQDPDQDETLADGVGLFSPRVAVLFGKKDGFQWSIGGAARFFNGIDEPIFRAHRPSPWTVDLSIAYAFRGF